ncbi:MAG: tRNA uridine-5-carboxymethylaminomethyl(34) synthesis GTPase MnmE, partial [Bacilli bacterium]|nr:tRNA uridine-5-carboxymethylaminomethyl(34) synthesis GTPase MnmE [Bacilli bacterium]
MFIMNRPIIALATPPIKGALAIIRLSGEGVFELIEKLFPKEINRSRRDLYFGPLKDLNGNVIDLVVVFAYPGPNSMTGEDVIEISCHGSMVIVEQIVEQFMALGATYATRGEFSSRAFYNGKMDLVEAESVNDLINATTIEAKNLALLSLTGETSKRVGPLKEEIASLLAQLEVGIDYPEYEDVEEATQETIINACTRIRARISSLISEGNDGRIIKEGINVALVGVPNVGKSSL